MYYENRSGCIQKGDRLLSLNKLYNLDQTTIQQILGDIGPNKGSVHPFTNWVEIEIEFDITDSVIPSSGVFNVKLANQNKSGLGITVNGSSHGSFIISDVKPGSAAHRTGSLRSGDILLAVNSLPPQHFNVDSLLMENKNDFTILTIKRNCLPDFLFDAQQRNNLYSLDGISSDDNKFKYLTKFNELKLDDRTLQQNYKDNGNTEYFQLGEVGGQTQQPPVAQIKRPFFSRMTEMATANRLLE